MVTNGSTMASLIPRKLCKHQLLWICHVLAILPSAGAPQLMAWWLPWHPWLAPEAACRGWDTRKDVGHKDISRMQKFANSELLVGHLWRQCRNVSEITSLKAFRAGVE